MTKDPKDEHKAAEHKAAEHKPDPKPTKTVKMQKGTDEVNHGTTSYPVPKDTGIVELPHEVAAHVIRQGGAQDLTPKAEPPKEKIDVINPANPDTTLGWNGDFYEGDSKGVFSVPVACLEDIQPHGFIPAPPPAEEGAKHARSSKRPDHS